MEDLGQKLYALQSVIMSLEARVSKIDAQVEAMDDDIGEADVPIVWGAGGGGRYSSYFKVIDASTTDVCKIGVTDGGWIGEDDPVNCGTVKVNGNRVDVPIAVSGALADGEYYAWIHTWYTVADGFESEIRFGTSTPPANPNDGIACASQLAGRVIVVGGVVSSITQDYLHGGEHLELLFGNCFTGSIN